MSLYDFVCLFRPTLTTCRACGGPKTRRAYGVMMSLVLLHERIRRPTQSDISDDKGWSPVDGYNRIMELSQTAFLTTTAAVCGAAA